MTSRPTFTRMAAAGLAAVLVLGACGGGDDGGGGGGGGDGDGQAAGPDEVDPSLCPVDALESASGPVKITFWHAMTAANEETLTELVDDYNASQDEVDVELVFSGSYDDTRDKYVTALRGGDLPDVVQLEETAIQLMIDSQSAVPAQACVDAEGYDTSDFVPRVLGEFSVEDVLWPMPFNVSNPVLFYNRKAFEAAGLDPDDPPATLDELTETSRTIVDSGAADYGMAVELSAWYVEQWLNIAGQSVVDNDNGRSGRATAATLDNDPALEALTWVKDMVDDGLAVSVGRNSSGADHLLAVGSGQAAMTIGTSAALGSVYDVLAGGDFPNVEPGVGPFPSLAADGPGGVAAGGAALWIVNRSTDEEQAAAWDFVKWLDEPEQQARWHVGTGYIPIRQSAAEMTEVTDLWAERPGFRVAYEQLTAEGDPPGGAGPVVGGYDDVREAIQSGLERMIAGSDPASVLSQIQSEADAAIEDYNQRTGND
jgi:sn-glycerol 3-phosphate transport system substrate-binding protein